MFKPFRKLVSLAMDWSRKKQKHINPAAYHRVIAPGRSVWEFDWAEIWRYRYMLAYLMRRDLVILYKQTV